MWSFYGHVFLVSVTVLDTPDTHWSTFIIMMVADELVPVGTRSSATTMLTGMWWRCNMKNQMMQYVFHITPIKQTMSGGRSATHCFLYWYIYWSPFIIMMVADVLLHKWATTLLTPLQLEYHINDITMQHTCITFQPLKNTNYKTVCILLVSSITATS